MAIMCFGSLSITCSKELLAEIRSFVKNGDKLLDLNRIVPFEDVTTAYESWGRQFKGNAKFKGAQPVDWFY